MGGGKGQKVAAPDYAPVAQANKEAAELAAQVSREQLAWAREQYAQDREVTQRFLDVMLPNMVAESEAGARERARYQEVFQPVEDALAREAADYATPERQALEAGKAQADVAQAFDAQRRGALATLESYGVDPSMARAGALDRSARITQAAAGAGAANAARTQVENVSRALRGEVINIGRGYPGSIAQAYTTAQQAGGGAVQSNLQTTASGANTMGTGMQWSGLQSGFLQNWGSNVAAQGQTYAAGQQARAQASAGIGAAIGGLAGLAGSIYTGGASLALAGALGGAGRGGGGGAGGGLPPSDRRLKREIRRIGTWMNGLPVYVWRYIWGGPLQTGFMADEVAKVHPNAVLIGPDGYARVRYDLAVLPA
jgi:hypothetical protein